MSGSETRARFNAFAKTLDNETEVRTGRYRRFSAETLTICHGNLRRRLDTFIRDYNVPNHALGAARLPCAAHLTAAVMDDVAQELRARMEANS